MKEEVGVTIEDVRRVAELANLELTAEEEPRMQRDLNAILGHIAQLNELNTAGIPAMAQVGEMLGGVTDTIGGSVASGCGAAFTGSCCGDGIGAGERWAILQGSQGD